jgi:hypothetical protein
VGAKKLVFVRGKFIQAGAIITIPCGAHYIVPSMGRLLALPYKYKASKLEKNIPGSKTSLFI